MRHNAITKYEALRESMLDRGWTLRRWALKKGHTLSTVYSAARGERSGVKARRIRRQLLQDFSA